MLLFLTGRCNLRCRICGVCDLEHGYNDEEELSTEQWKGVISAAAEKLGTTLAVVSGGEALLREDVFEIIHYAESKGISVHLCTNALLLNEDKMERLRDSGVSTVSFSLDGPEAFIHDDI
ncbi:MAG: radical SAM protein, partial [Candidatus Hydrogenedentes bacterium]|nr:radical SAM protein [Candidatus Hydrogenedentota bacterium]